MEAAAIEPAAGRHEAVVTTALSSSKLAFNAHLLAAHFYREC
jgi:hypothetical protein